jgi:hypothetical protein
MHEVTVTDVRIKRAPHRRLFYARAHANDEAMMFSTSNALERPPPDSTASRSIDATPSTSPGGAARSIAYSDRGRVSMPLRATRRAISASSVPGRQESRAHSRRWRGLARELMRLADVEFAKRWVQFAILHATDKGRVCGVRLEWHDGNVEGRSHVPPLIAAGRSRMAASERHEGPFRGCVLSIAVLRGPSAYAHCMRRHPAKTGQLEFSPGAAIRCENQRIIVVACQPYAR